MIASVLASTTIGLTRQPLIIDAIVMRLYQPYPQRFQTHVDYCESSVLMAAFRDHQHKENFGSVTDGLGSAVIFHNHPKHQ
jgi:hypothetical protein